MAKVSILKLLEVIAPILPAPIYWEDVNSILLGGNEAVFNVTGAMLAEAYVGKTLFELYPKEMAQYIKQHNDEVMRTGKVLAQEEMIKDISTGETKYFTAIKAPLRDDEGNIIGIVGTSINITDQKKLMVDLKQAKDKAELANEAKTEFLANMRHGIRTPLSGIIGFSELLKSESNEPRIKEYSDNLVASSHALLHLLDEVLDAIKVSSGEIPLLKKKFNLVEILEHVTQLYLAKSAEKKLSLSFSYDPELPRFVIGDGVRLHRIVLELVGNALNFTNSGQVVIRAEQAKREQHSLVLQLTVTDTGMGIPKDKQQDIYVQFKRLTPSYQGIYQGAGLGLYVVKQFIDELNGEIYVDSEPNKGTIFTCLIPLQVPLLDNDAGVDTLDVLKNPTPWMPLLAQQNHISPLNDKALSHILVVEDNFIAQTVVKTLLSGMNCQVDVASTGIDAIALCKTNHYDLIFMDIGLGEGMDGYKVTHRIRNLSNTTKDTPIIALTAHGGDESKQRCIEAGMDAVLTKPLTQAHAIDILKSFIPVRHEVPVQQTSKARLDLPDRDEEMFQLSQFALLNSEEALKNCGTHKMLNELLTVMTQALPADLESMKKAFAVKDYPRVEKAAHKIKGGAFYVGTTRMKYACQYLERYWKSGERELLDALYHQAVNTIEETITYIEGWMRH